MPDSLVIDVGVAKTEKYASRESGDTVELIERPSGGISIVMIDGQGSGRAAKTLSLLLSSKAVALVKEGVRDGVVARATHDFLFAFRHGQVSATLDLLSIDLKTRTIVITRNAEAPMLLQREGEVSVLPALSGPIGRYRWTKPSVDEFPMQAGVDIILFTDGIPHSGRRANLPPMDLDAWGKAHLGQGAAAQELADALLVEVRARDDDRPNDDMAVVALSLHPGSDQPAIRRMQLQVHLP
ncbi:MAG TPA: SpoIIE family protein phosphatase [Thermomicrobiales bacterium]|nr:SpoIIE family protein phosphatase [Thermomicrobiales bacterium]